MLPESLDGHLLTPPAVLIADRLDRLVTDSHFRAGLPVAAARETARPLVEEAFRISCEVRHNCWMPRRVIKVGRAIVRGAK